MYKKLLALTLCACAALGAETAAAYSNADLNRVLSGENCVGGDLSGADLSGLNLCYRDFTGTDFTEARLDGTVLDNALLDNANFTNALMARVSARHASMNGADFSFATATLNDEEKENGREKYENDINEINLEREELNTKYAHILDADGNLNINGEYVLYIEDYAENGTVIKNDKMTLNNICKNFNIPLN